MIGHGVSSDLKKRINQEYSTLTYEECNRSETNQINAMKKKWFSLRDTRNRLSLEVECNSRSVWGEDISNGAGPEQEYYNAICGNLT